MPSIFDVNVADVGGSILGGVSAGFKEKQKRQAAEQAQLAEQQEKQAKQAKIGSLIDRIQDGDRGAALEIAALDPKTSGAIEKALAGFDDTQTKNVNEWLAGYASAADKDEYVSRESALNIDDKFRSLDPEERDFTAKVFAAQSMTEQAFNAAFGSPKGTKFEQGRGNLEGYNFDPSTGRFAIDKDLKRSLNEKAIKAAEAGRSLTARGRQSINKDVTALVKSAVDISNSAKDLKKLKETASPTDQLAAIFKLMKALDPESVVREGEQKQARSTGGPADVFVGFVNQIRGEGRLPPAVFSDMVNTAETLAGSQSSSTKVQVDSYLDAYESSIPESFKDKLRSRVPRDFGDFKDLDSFSDEADALEAELFGGGQ